MPAEWLDACVMLGQSAPVLLHGHAEVRYRFYGYLKRLREFRAANAPATAEAEDEAYEYVEDDDESGEDCVGAEEEPVFQVGCDCCQKWHFVPDGFEVPDAATPWTCADAPDDWGIDASACDAPAEAAARPQPTSPPASPASPRARSPPRVPADASDDFGRPLSD